MTKPAIKIFEVSQEVMNEALASEEGDGTMDIMPSDTPLYRGDFVRLVNEGREHLVEVLDIARADYSRGGARELNFRRKELIDQIPTKTIQVSQKMMTLISDKKGSKKKDEPIMLEMSFDLACSLKEGEKCKLTSDGASYELVEIVGVPTGKYEDLSFIFVRPISLPEQD